MPLENNLPDLPPYSLDVQAMDLGSDTKAVGLELIETESREPLRGEEAASIWAAVFPALVGDETWVLDFFSHLDRVREYCKTHEVEFRSRGGEPVPGDSSARWRNIARIDCTIRGRNIWIAVRCRGERSRCHSRERAFASRTGCLSGRLYAIHILRDLRNG